MKKAKIHMADGGDIVIELFDNYNYVFSIYLHDYSSLSYLAII